jgi:hypothetical protein
MPVKAQGLIGADLTNSTANLDVRTAAQVTAAGSGAFKNGTLAWGDDGCLYVYGKTAGSISSAARVDFVISTGLITAAAAGAFVNSNGATIESGGAAWFRGVQNYTAATGLVTVPAP